MTHLENHFFYPPAGVRAGRAARAEEPGAVLPGRAGRCRGDSGPAAPHARGHQHDRPHRRAGRAGGPPGCACVCSPVFTLSRSDSFAAECSVTDGWAMLPHRAKRVQKLLPRAPAQQPSSSAPWAWLNTRLHRHGFEKGCCVAGPQGRHEVPTWALSVLPWYG